MKFEFDVNPDCMNQEELQELRQKLFNRRGKGFRILRDYCHNKQCAIGYRLDGKINTAMIYEKSCDNLYNQLPKHLKSW